MIDDKEVFRLFGLIDPLVENGGELRFESVAGECDPLTMLIGEGVLDIRRLSSILTWTATSSWLLLVAAPTSFSGAFENLSGLVISMNGNDDSDGSLLKFAVVGLLHWI